MGKRKHKGKPKKVDPVKREQLCLLSSEKGYDNVLSDALCEKHFFEDFVYGEQIKFSLQKFSERMAIK
ncbi:unnamed protein product [Moneuplotes crassus]|uniref:Uncharacterized protein n=1 Tax=Euplotes crassus TaxID=5936 RepID=A0AAD1XWF7_EUPCR|nr:unnamed protein product [Moneuplotes crassus]